MRGDMVVPERVQSGFIGHPRGKFKPCQSIDADAPELAKWPVSRLAFGSMGLDSFQGYTFSADCNTWKNV